MNKQLILFGAANAGISMLQKAGYDNVFCFADNIKTGNFWGKKIISFDELKKVADSYDIIVTSGNENAERAIMNQLNNAGIKFYTPANFDAANKELSNKDILSIEQEGVFTLAFADFVKRNKPDTFALVGAASGGYARIAGHFMSDDARIYLFEPMPQFFKVIHNTFASDKRVHLIRKAVSNKPGRIDLHSTIKNNMFNISHSFTIDKDETMFGSEYDKDDVKLTATVSTVTLDEFFKDENVNLMLMDIEGAEVFAVEGMEKLIAKRRTTFFMEVHEPYIKALQEDGMDYMTSVFKDSGYHFYWCELTESGDYKAERGGVRVIPTDELKWEHCIISPNPIDEEVLSTWILSQ